MAVGARQHVVVLVPGFLAFAPARDRALRPFERAGRGREDSRVAGVLRAALEAHCGVPVPVVALPLAEEPNLATRQRVLLKHLQALDGSLLGVRQFHLVGHGPGGVDAELLTQSLPLKTGATWHDLDPTHLRERIASVVTLGAPHYGTQLADHPLVAGWRRPQSLDFQALRQVTGATSSVVRKLLRRILLAGSPRRSGTRRVQPREYGLAAVPLLLALIRESELLRELSPHSMQALRAHNLPDPSLGVRVQNIVLAAPELTTEEGGVLRLRNGLFSALHTLTAQRSLVEPPLPLSQAQKLLRQVPEERIVRHASARVPSFDLSVNDGLVNTVRQLLVTRAQQEHALAAVVIADHADVLGHYDRRSPFAPEVCEQGGLLRSGANFGDDEFFHLWGLVAAQIASIALSGAVDAHERDTGCAADEEEVAAQ